MTRRRRSTARCRPARRLVLPRRGYGSISTPARCLLKASSRSALACPTVTPHPVALGRIGHKGTLRAFAANLAHLRSPGDDRRGVALGRLRPAVEIRGAIISRRGTRSIRSKACRSRWAARRRFFAVRSRAGLEDDELAFAAPAYGRRPGWRSRPRCAHGNPTASADDP